jgi:hypothetical protein
VVWHEARFLGCMLHQESVPNDASGFPTARVPSAVSCSLYACMHACMRFLHVSKSAQMQQVVDGQLARTAASVVR